MKQLKFLNPVFHKGENITVRRGTKWSGVTGIVPINENFNAEILYTQSFVFSQLPDDIICLEHDPTCRTWEGLYTEMGRVYEGFLKNEIVTVIHFKALPAL